MIKHQAVMDKLSQELIDIIVSFIPYRAEGARNIHELGRRIDPRVLAPLATVSRKFQRSIESLTFRRLIIDTSDEGLAQFERIMGGQKHRRSCIRVLRAIIRVAHNYVEPPAEDARRVPPPYETDKDREAERQALTATLRRLWDFIATWDENAACGQRIRLSLETVPTFITDLANTSPFFHRYPLLTFSLLDLTADAVDFPTLPCIDKFDFSSRHGRHWNPRVAAVLTSSMPNLEAIGWDLDNGDCNWGRYYSIDKRYRHGLVEGIRALRLPPSVEAFSLCLKEPFYEDIGEALPQFIENGAPDDVGRAVRNLTRHGVNIALDGPFDSSLFDPPRSGQAATVAEAEELPYWQHTTRLLVEVKICGPDGSWLFRPRIPVPGPGGADVAPEGILDCTRLPPGYGETAEDNTEAENFYKAHHGFITPISRMTRFSALPDDDKLNTMLTAFARCLARMPALEFAHLRMVFSNNVGWAFQVLVGAPSYRFPYWDVDPEEGEPVPWRIYLLVSWWRPTDATIEELKNIGVKKGGQPSTLQFLPAMGV